MKNIVMPNIYIVTDEEKIRFGSKEYAFSKGFPSRYCVEEVSEEMYEALLHIGSMEEHKTSVAFVLYSILSQKGISNN